MIYAIMGLLMLPILIVMFRNGQNGRGYKISYKPPALDTNRGKIIRLAGLLYGLALLGVVFIGRYQQSTQDGYRGTGRVVEVLVFFLLSFGLRIYLLRKRNK